MQNTYEKIKRLYELDALPPDVTSKLKRLEGLGALDQGLKSISQNSDFISKIKNGTYQSPSFEKSEIPEQALPMGASIPGMYPELIEKGTTVTGEDVKKMGRITATMARPVLEATGATIGGTLGATGGPVGAASGGGLGFALGAEIADVLDVLTGLKKPESIMVELSDAAKNVILGTTFEAGGQVIGKSISGTAEYIGGSKPAQYVKQQFREAIPTLKAKILQKRAGDVLAATTANGNIIAKNREEAQALEELIPGLKFTRGQLTNDPSVINFERSLGGESADFRNALIERKAANTEAVKNFLESYKGKGNVEDTKSLLQLQKTWNENLVKKGEDLLEGETVKLGKGKGITEAGKTIREELEVAKKTAKRTGKEIYKSIPNFEINASGLIKKLNEISRPMSKYESVSENVPNKLFGRIRSDLIKSKGKTTPKDLDGFRSELKAELRKATSPGTEINERKISRLSKAVNAVDDTLSSIGKETTIPTSEKEKALGYLKTKYAGTKSPRMQNLIKTLEDEVSKIKEIKSAVPTQYAEARKFYKKEYIDKFKTGDVNDVLRPGGTGYKVDDAQVVSKFFKSGEIGKTTARRFLKAVGTNKRAMGAIEDAIKQNFLKEAVNPVNKKITEASLKRWLSKYLPALKELKLESKFDNISSARQKYDEAIGLSYNFDKSEASKFLNADVGQEINKALSSGPKWKAINNLMKRIRGNKAAVEGVRNALIEEIQKVPVTHISNLYKTFDRYKPAINAAFYDSPDKIRAMKTYMSALKKLDIGRTEPGDIAGTDTQQKLLSTFFRISGMTGGRILEAVRLITRPLRAVNEKEATNLFIKASLDPDFAFTLMRAAKGKDRSAIRNLYIQTLQRIGKPELIEKIKKDSEK